MNYAVNIVREYVKNNLWSEWVEEYEKFKRITTEDYIDFVGQARKQGLLMYPVAFTLSLDIETKKFIKTLIEIKDPFEIKVVERMLVGLCMGIEYPEIVLGVSVGALVDVELSYMGSEFKSVLEDDEEKLISFTREDSITGGNEKELLKINYTMSVGDNGIELNNFKTDKIKEVGSGDKKKVLENDDLSTELSDFYRKVSSVGVITGEEGLNKLMEVLVKYDVLK